MEVNVIQSCLVRNIVIYNIIPRFILQKKVGHTGLE